MSLFTKVKTSSPHLRRQNASNQIPDFEKFSAGNTHGSRQLGSLFPGSLKGERRERKEERKEDRKEEQRSRKERMKGRRERKRRDGRKRYRILPPPPPLTKSWIRHGLIMSIDCTKSYACSSTAFCKPSRNLYGRRHKSRNVLIYWAQNVHNAMTIGSLSATAVLSVSVGNNRYH